MKNLINNNSFKRSSYSSKLNWFLFFTLLVLVLNLDTNSNTFKETKTKTETEKKLNTEKTNTNTESASTLSAALKGNFWVQRMYPGNDVFDNIKESEYSNSKKYLEVNDEVIFIAKSLQRKSEVEDSLNIKEIYDSVYDNYTTAKCCSRVSYEEFPLTNSLKNIIPAKKNKVLKKKKRSFLEKTIEVENKSESEKEKKDTNSRVCRTKGKAKDISANKINPVSSPSLSKKASKRIKKSEAVPNLCILIHVPDEAKWRICHTSKKEINKLFIKITYSVIKLKSKNNPKIMEKIIANPRIFTKPTIGAWDWDHQEKWKNRCKSSFMQSPINIATSSIKKPKTHFDMAMNLKQVHTLIKKNFGEIIVVFRNFGGVLKLTVDGAYLNFTPQYMSFRFPGETIIDGKRSEGDIQLHFAEMKRKTPVFIYLFFLLFFIFYFIFYIFIRELLLLMV